MNSHDHIIILITCAVFALICLAETIHHLRSRRVAKLAFGPTGRARIWTMFAPLVRVVAVSMFCLALMILFFYKGEQESANKKKVIPDNLRKKIVVLYDASPSMGLCDAGSGDRITRRKRAKYIIESILERINIDQVLFTVVAFFTDARVVFDNVKDPNLLYNFIDDLPISFAFKPGKTSIKAGLKKVAEIASEWQADSTTVLVITDGDTVPDSGVPKMPPAISQIMFIGVGDAKGGIFFDDHRSRQDSKTLQTLAKRLQGEYYDGNFKNIPSEALNSLAESIELTKENQLNRRTIALVLLAISSFLLMILPILLEYFGCTWNAKMKLLSLQRRL